MALSSFVFAKITGSLWEVAKSRILAVTDDWKTVQKLKSRLETSTMQAIEDLEPMLAAENISAKQQDFLVDWCLIELKPLLQTPQEFFAGSLTGEKLYKRLYEKTGPPAAIVEESLEQCYRLVFPRIADRFCAYLPLIDRLKVEGFKEILKRFDTTDEKLNQIAAEFKTLTEKPKQQSDLLFHQFYQTITAEILASLALTGLHGEMEYQVGIDDIFVLPSLTKIERTEGLTIESPDSMIEAFASNGGRNVIEGSPGSGRQLGQVGYKGFVSRIGEAL